ncbi:hypothetical protein Micbo1qcDRAFT_106863, partial [Microdochium bolleyi]
ALLPTALAQSSYTRPPPPGLTFLYSLNATIAPAINLGASPLSNRTIYPITGGSFEGPMIKGTVMNLGADWGINDRDGVFHPDTRYHLQTDDGAPIYIRTEGPTQPSGITYLRIYFETGHPKYYWLNNLVTVGLLYGPVDANYVLIDAY